MLYKENAFTENEAFVRMMEDPLVHIKTKEKEEKQRILNNPLLMKQIL